MKKTLIRTMRLPGVIVLAAVLALSFAACATSGSGAFVPEAFTETTAAETVANIRVGWNLGNTLDCYDLAWLGSNTSPSDYEKAWGNPVTRKSHFDALKEAGFNAVRLPVSWAKCADANYTIRASWLARVKTVVNFAASNDMYIILNTHHDEELFKFTDAEMEKATAAFKKIWEQIADTFKDYDEKLIFEGLNEPRTKGSPAEWNGGTPEERKNLNTYYQIFVDTVRASGGNNDKRILMINTYGASGLEAPISDLKIPTDTAANKIVVSYHAYEPYSFALNTDPKLNTWSKDNAADTAPITERVDRAYNTFVSKGIPVIIGEFGAVSKNNTAVRAEWAEFYVGYAKSKGIPCFWWDNGSGSGSGEKLGILNRSNNKFTFPEIVEGLMKGSGE